MISTKTILKNILPGIILILVGSVPAGLVYYNLSSKITEGRASFSSSMDEINSKLNQIDSLKDSVSALSTASAVTPTPTITPKPTTNTTKKWTFTKSQYEVKISNASYGKENLVGYKIEFDVNLKNISINPFITGFSISDCIVVNGETRTQFMSAVSKKYEKALLPNETKQDRVRMVIHGTDYDRSGNKIGPTSDTKVKSCSFYPLTTKIETARQLEPYVSPTPSTEKTVEPTTIYFQ